MIRNRTVKSSIAKRFVIYIILFSSVITLFITAIQLYRDYNNDIEYIHIELEQIEGIHLNSLTAALWTSNQKLLQTSIEGILRTRDVQFVEVRDKQQVWATAGKIIGDDSIERHYTMSYQHRNKDINIGILTVYVSLDGVYQRLHDKVLVILISNAIKTSIVALFMYFLFYNLVGRHLSTISVFSAEHDPLTNNELLLLDRHNKKYDELDIVVDSINDMHIRLNAQISEINHQKKYLSLTLNSIGDAVITTDDEGKVTRLNPVAEQLTGWINDEAHGLPIETIFPIVNAVTREPILNPIERVLATGETVYLSNDTTLIAKNGEEYQIADSAAPIRKGDKILGVVLVFNDVTEQYQMRAALHESEQRLRQLAENLNEVFWLCKPDWSEVLYISPSYEKKWGLSVEELYRNPLSWFESVHDDDRQQLLEMVSVDPKDINEYIDFQEFRLVNADKTTLWIKARAYPIRDSLGNVIRIAGIAEDITARKNSDEVFRRSQKMDALGKLTGGIAHDYNNMLGIVMGYAAMLHDKLDGQPELLKYTDEIMHAAQRGSKLTKKLLTFSSNKSIDAERLSINSVLHGVQHMLEKTLTVRIKLVFKFENELWPVYLDESELEDTILNISINAMHAIESDGELIIETSNKRIDKLNAEQLDLELGDYVCLIFTDNGCGMDEATKENIFDPFYTTKGEKGTGLGLTQVYGFINRSGGVIKVESQIKHGSQFTLYFPRYQGDDRIKHQTSAKVNIGLKGKESILVVDDEVALLNLTCEILAQHDYNIYRAERAKDALLIMETEHIDVLVSDVIMPGMNGYELVSIVQKKYPYIKIQLVSGFSDIYNNEQVETNLIHNMLQKPFTTSTLLNRIRTLLQ